MDTLRRLWRVRRSEAAVALAGFLGVTLLGVLPGIGVAVGLSLLIFLRRAWRPHDTVLGRVTGMKGYHDVGRHPEAMQVPGLVLYRFDAPLFFANADYFQDQVARLVGEQTAGLMGDRRSGADHGRRHHRRRDARGPRS